MSPTRPSQRRIGARVAAALLLAAIGLSGCNGGDTEPEVLGTLERDRFELTAESNDRIAEIAVREGDRVTAGTVLVRQQTDAVSARLAQASATVAEQERRLEELQHGPRAREIEAAEAALTGAQGSLETAEQEFERMRKLVERKLQSQAVLDEADARRDRARADRDTARANLRLMREGTRPEQIAQAKAAVAGARASLTEIETSAARYTVVAPRDGFIEALPFEIGERPPAGATVVVLLADGEPFARVHVPEPLRARYVPGTRVEVRADGVDGVLAGRVRFIASQAAFTPYGSLTQHDRSRLAFLAEIDLTDARAAELPAGLPVQVRLGAPPP